MKKSLVLVLNCGSSSIKFAVINPKTEKNFLSGLIECIGTKDTRLSWKVDDQKEQKALAGADYHRSILEIVELLKKTDHIIDNLIGVGHRVVHGGEHFVASALIDDKVLSEIEACIQLAPLHNPANVKGIKLMQEQFPRLPQVAVFDTAFHQTMPPQAYIYAIPYELYEEHAIRRYGFHGTSHYYVTKKAAEILNKPLTKSSFISAHLGNGCSLAAVLNGKCLDTTMGLTPLEGLVMGTRSGDVDPGLHSFLVDKLGYDIHYVTNMLNKQSGLLGISGKYSDMRDLWRAVEEGDERAILATDIFCYRLAKYICALMVPLHRLDALIFTGGIGENDNHVREKVINLLPAMLNFKLDKHRNDTKGRDSGGIVTKDDSSIAIIVPTNEELVIAQDVLNNC